MKHIKNLYTILIFIVLSLNTFAQYSVINVPRSSMPEKTEAVKQKINEIPFYTPTTSLKSTNEIASIDNSTLKYFPPIFDQIGNSCSQASGIRYIFSYEINRLRDADGSLNQNQYAYHYTWNFLNEGTDMGSWYFDGFELVKDNGVPNITDFNDQTATERTWMSGYEKYYNAIHNKIEEYSKIDAGMSNGLELIKQYLIDHGEGSEIGGLLVFSGKTSNWEVIQYDGSSLTNYKHAVRNFGDGGDHAMTIAGFDDSVKVDVNMDGQIQDDEIGALIIVNSWGKGWGSNGRAYMPYKLLTKSWWDGGIGNGDKYVYLITAKDHEPSVVGKLNIKYTSRNDLWFLIGVAESVTAESAERVKTVKIMKKQGGDFHMQGINSDSGKKIEIALDYSDLIDKVPEAKKFFVTVKQSLEGDLGEGVVEGFTVYDYRNNVNNPESYASSQTNISIESSVVLSAQMDNTSSGVTEELIGLQVYPNPVKSGGKLYVQHASEQIQTVELYNILGKKYAIQWKNNAGSIEIELPKDLMQGLYYIKLRCSNCNLCYQILIQEKI